MHLFNNITYNKNIRITPMPFSCVNQHAIIGKQTGKPTKCSDEPRAQKVSQQLRGVVNDGRHAEQCGASAQVLQTHGEHMSEHLVIL